MYLKDITGILQCANKTARNLAQEHHWKPLGRGGYDVDYDEVLRVASIPRDHYGNRKMLKPTFDSVRIIEAWPIKPKEQQK